MHRNNLVDFLAAGKISVRLEEELSYLGAQWDVIKQVFENFPLGTFGAMATTRIMPHILSGAL